MERPAKSRRVPSAAAFVLWGRGFAARCALAAVSAETHPASRAVNSPACFPDDQARTERRQVEPPWVSPRTIRRLRFVIRTLGRAAIAASDRSTGSLAAGSVRRRNDIESVLDIPDGCGRRPARSSSHRFLIMAILPQNGCAHVGVLTQNDLQKRRFPMRDSEASRRRACRLYRSRRT